ncbi:hypothetical protein GCM10009416_12470 [Craurococcus roseus]|uniref:Uncharacterized protein n=1 Tax=Craurococcus roseus TaxID=77585 RepID=A0ABN1EVC3_9PROT
MPDFVIVAATVAMLAGPALSSDASATASAPASLNTPTVGFRTYPDAVSCERAAATLVAPAGARLVCLPVEPTSGEMANAY